MVINKMNTNSHKKPMPLNRWNTVKNHLEAYNERPEDVLALEIVSNALDANAKNLWFSFDSRSVWFYNDGDYMDDHTFETYHSFSISEKVKGAGHGLRGQGAKLILGLDSDIEILTVSKKDSGEMQVGTMDNFNIGYGRDLNISLNHPTDWKRIHGKSFKNGTTVSISLPSDMLKRMSENLEDVIRKNFWIILDDFNIMISGKHVEPENFEKISSKKLKNSEIVFYKSDKDLPDERLHILSTVYGKVIGNAKPYAKIHEVKPDFRTKIFCTVDMTELYKNNEFDLLTQKDGVRKSVKVNKIYESVNSEFSAFLKSNDMLEIQKKLKSDSRFSISLGESCFDMFKRSNLLDLLNFSSKPVRSDSGRNIVTTEVVPVGNIQNESLKTELLPQNDSPKIDEHGTDETAKYIESSPLDSTLKGRKSKNSRFPIYDTYHGGLEAIGYYDKELNKIMVNVDFPLFKSVKDTPRVYNTLVLVLTANILIDNKVKEGELWDSTKVLSTISKVLSGFKSS
jgi:hypothetical protein